jgi:hypothetical protein
MQNFTQVGGRADFLRPFIWSCVSGLMQFCDGSNIGTASLHNNFCQSWTFLSRVITGGAGFKVMTLGQSNNPPTHPYSTRPKKRDR